MSCIRRTKIRNAQNNRGLAHLYVSLGKVSCAMYQLYHDMIRDLASSD